MAYQKVSLAQFPRGDARKNTVRDTKYYTNNKKGEKYLRPDIKKKRAIAEASGNGRCWWIAQYLRDTL